MVNVNKLIADAEYSATIGKLQRFSESLHVLSKPHTIIICINFLSAADKEKLVNLFPEYFLQENLKKTNQIFESIIKESILKEKVEFQTLMTFYKIELEKKESELKNLEKAYNDLKEFNQLMSQFYSDQQIKSINILLASIKNEMKQTEKHIQIISRTIILLNEELQLIDIKINKNIAKLNNLLDEVYSSDGKDQTYKLKEYNFEFTKEEKKKFPEGKDPNVIILDINKIKKSVLDKVKKHVKTKHINDDEIQVIERTAVEKEAYNQVKEHFNYLSEERATEYTNRVTSSAQYKEDINNICVSLKQGKEEIYNKAVSESADLQSNKSFKKNIEDEINLLKSELKNDIQVHNRERNILNDSIKENGLEQEFDEKMKSNNISDEADQPDLEEFQINEFDEEDENVNNEDNQLSEIEPDMPEAKAEDDPGIEKSPAINPNYLNPNQSSDKQPYEHFSQDHYYEITPPSPLYNKSNDYDEKSDNDNSPSFSKKR